MKHIFLSFLGLVALNGCDHYTNKMAQNDAMMTMPAAGYTSLDAVQTGYVGEYEPSIATLNTEASYNYGPTFASQLAAEYHNLALYEQNQAYDYKAAALYTNKASLLNEGQMVGPVALRGKRLPVALKEELAENRFFLIEMIKDYPFPENRKDFAVAQTRFDCWVDQAQEAPNNPAHHTCKAQFDDALVNVFLRQEDEIDALFES